MEKNIYGIWIGEDSVVAITEEMTITFLRLEKDMIASVLRHNEKGVLGVVYGHGNGYIGKEHTHTAAVICDSDNKIVENNNEANDFISLHSNDKVSFDENTKKLIYATYNNKIFENILAEKIEMSDFARKNEIDNSLSVAEKITQWNIGTHLEISKKCLSAGINTRRYSLCYDVDWSGCEIGGEKLNEFIYCRVGQNGYCKKGWAMLPTIQIRHHYTGMTEDNLSTIQEYKPNEDWFVVDGCSFPEDGGWYWSIKEITDDIIYLQGCGGQTYEIPRN